MLYGTDIMRSEMAPATDDIALSVRGLSRTYGSIRAVDDLDLDVRTADIYGFLGPNGAGKTTAMRCMLGLIRRDAGTISVFGERHAVRQRRAIGAVVETPVFHNWMTARSNLDISASYAGIPVRNRKREVERVLDRVGLLSRSRQRVRGYSLGMRQRLGIARALLGTPKLLMLDEPTNGLDPRGMNEMRELLVSLAADESITIFVSSHLLSEVQAMCNRVGIIQGGTMRVEGQVDELVRRYSTGEHLEFDASDRAALKTGIESLEGCELRGSTQQGRLRVKLVDTTVPRVVRALVESGIELEAVVPANITLEDVFLEVTSKWQSP